MTRPETRLDADGDALLTLFTEAGFEPVCPAHLFPAETLLELYGEDIRSRAFLFSDPAYDSGSNGGTGGELCLRPDFTVPVAMLHGNGGWERAGRYCYNGPVFRRQEAGTSRPIEYLQAGIEDFGDTDEAAADCRVFKLIHLGLDALSAPPRRTRIGDPGVVFAMLDALNISDWRRRLLRRHMWRPARFRELLEGFVGAAPDSSPSHSPRRAELFAAVTEDNSGDGFAELLERAGGPVGLRSPAAIRDRAAALLAASDDSAMSAECAQLIETVLALQCSSADAPACLADALRAGGKDLPAKVEVALTRLSQRLDALADAGFDLSDIAYDAAFGRTLEYYDGFVFEVAAEDQPDGPPLAGGGRYDAMTLRLGAGAKRPAVGGIIRPEAVREAKARCH